MASIRFDSAALRKAFTEGAVSRADLELVAKQGVTAPDAQAAFQRISKAGDVRVTFAQVERFDGGPAIGDLQKFAAQLLSEHAKTQADAKAFGQRQAANHDALFGGAVVERFAGREAANDPVAAALAQASSAPAPSLTARLDAEIEAAAKDGVVQLADFGKLMTALGHDLKAATKPDAQAVMERAQAALDALYAKTKTLPHEAEFLRYAVVQFTEAYDRGGATAVIEFGARLAELKAPVAQAVATPRAFAAITRALEDAVVQPNEFGPILRAMAEDLAAGPSVTTLRELIAALNLVSTRVRLDASSDAPFRGLYDELAKLIGGQVLPPSADVSRLAQTFEREFPSS